VYHEKDIVMDLLKDERFLNLVETHFAVEASEPVKQVFLEIMREEQNLHSRLVQYMEQKGWAKTLPGDIATGINQSYAQAATRQYSMMY